MASKLFSPTILIIVLFCGGLALCNTVEHEKQSDFIIDHWTKLHKVEDHLVIPLRIALKQRNLDHGADLLHSISDPDSERYGRHLSTDEVAKMFEPSYKTLETTRKWLESAGIEKERIFLPYSKQWMRINATALELKKLTNAQYHYWAHKDSSDISIACDSYFFPQEVSDHVDFLLPGTHPTRGFERINGRSKEKRSLQMDEVSPIESRTKHPAMRADNVTPSKIYEIYEINDTVHENPNNTLAVWETYDAYQQSALDNFFTKFAKNIPNGTHPAYKRIDDNAPIHDGHYEAIEGDPDLEIAYPLVYPDPIIWYQVNDFHYARDANNPRSGVFNVFLDALNGNYCNYTAFGITGDSPGIDPKYPDPAKGGYKGNLECGVYKPAKVISFSFTAAEAYFPYRYQLRQCSEFLKFGLMGTTLVFGAGDDGPNAYFCFGSRHDPREDEAFSPASTAGCPWVTAVGATKIKLGDQFKAGNEVAAAFGNYYRSGGGFSNIHLAPKYQSNVTQAYLKSNPPPFKSYATSNVTAPPTYKNGSFVGIYNRVGRGYPDVSAFGQNISTFDERGPYAFSGTSASTPLFSGIIARINNHRLAAGKSTVGFINPVLYKHPKVFNDVTEGSNPACGRAGFVAAKGWDPVTGLGTPNYSKLKAVFMSLP